jgi:hypothetical protein
MGGICSRSSTQKNQQQQLLAICSSDSRQVSAQYSRVHRGYWRCVGSKVGPWRAGRWHVGATAWAQSARSQPPACWSRLPAGHRPYGRLRASQSTNSVGVQQRQRLSVQGRYCTMSGLGCLSEADRPKISAEERRGLWLNLIRRKMLFSCLKAIPSWTGSSGSGTW